MLIGVSNGAVPAAALATRLDASALWLASGCADPSPELDPVRCPVVLTVADWESFWGGPAGVVAAAADFHPTIFHFHGWHAWEPWGVCLRALRAVQNFLL